MPEILPSQPHGKLTAKMANLLSRNFQDRGIRVLWDPHGISRDSAPLAQPGKIKCSFGTALARETELAALDLVVLMGDRPDAVALIEVEETNATPKTLFGDALAVLTGERISFRGQDLRISRRTTLILAAHATLSRKTAETQARFISSKLQEIKTSLAQSNLQSMACTENIVVDVFDDEAELGALLTKRVESAVSTHSALE